MNHLLTFQKFLEKKEWSKDVTENSVATYPPKGIFTKSAEEIAKVMARKKVSPKGIGSAIQMCQFMINRAGKNMPAKQKAEIKKAIKILQKKNEEKKD